LISNFVGFQAVCNMFGGQLVEIENDEENEFVQEHVMEFSS